MYGLLFMVALMGLMALASNNVRSKFMRFAQIPLRARISGAQVARRVLDSNGLSGVRIERIGGELTDHYDPRDKVLRLSPIVYDGHSLASAGVAAHEAGHALQDKYGYAPLQIRQGIFPLANFGSTAGAMMIPLGILGAVILGPLGWGVALAGLLLYGFAVLFSVVTLPVEYNASSRAMEALARCGIVSSQEYDGTKKVLDAAALTYVAATLGTVATFLYYAWMMFGFAEE